VAEHLSAGVGQRHAQIAVDAVLRERRVARERGRDARGVQAERAAGHLLARRPGQLVLDGVEDAARGRVLTRVGEPTNSATKA
jgi:hypothetical protein